MNGKSDRRRRWLRFVFFCLVVVLAWIVFNSLTENESVDLQQKADATLHSRLFIERIEQHYSDLRNALDSRKFNEAVRIYREFVRYGQTSYRDVSVIGNDAEHQLAVQKAQQERLLSLQRDYATIKRASANPDALSSAEIDEALAACQRVLAVERNSTSATLAMKTLTDAGAEQAAEEMFYGPPPIPSPWDGSVSEVEDYLNATLNDPYSVKYSAWSGVYRGAEGYLVYCEYRAKNLFGAYVLTANWFVIRQGHVIQVKPWDAYSVP